MDRDDILKNIYYDIEPGFGSVRSLYDETKKDGAVLTLDYVKNWVKRQNINQRSGYKNYNSYSSPYARAEYQIDIMDMVSLMKDTDTYDKKRIRYALMCIDIFSKKVHIVPLKNRDGETVYNAFIECIKVLGFPNSLYTDDDGAFNYKPFQEYLKGEGIRHITTLTHANVAERAIRTFKKMIGDRVLHTKGDWIEMLKPVLKKYNGEMKHGTTGYTPNEGHKDDILMVKANSVLKEKYLRKYPNIEGNKVKIYDKGKGNYTSRKEIRSKWTEQTYTITKVGRDLMLNKYFEVQGRSKTYNRHELLLVEVE